MRRPQVRVSPSRDYRKHSRIQVTLEVRQPLSALELARLAQTLQRWTGELVRVVLCAGEELEWVGRMGRHTGRCARASRAGRLPDLHARRARPP